MNPHFTADCDVTVGSEDEAETCRRRALAPELGSLRDWWRGGTLRLREGRVWPGPITSLHPSSHNSGQRASEDRVSPEAGIEAECQ